LKSFGSLWKFKNRGNTLEIITPYATTNNKFVSVFLTKQGKDYIVTDGGWIDDGVYENITENEANCFQKLYFHYEAAYDISTLEDKSGKQFYFKRTGKQIMIPSLVFDLANFISAIVSASLITFEDIKEKEEVETFGKQANNYVHALLKHGTTIKLNKPIDNQHKTVRFSAIITYTSKLTLINYVTGSNSNYFVNSICKASANFELAGKSGYSSHIKYKLSLLNDSAEGYATGKLYSHLELLESKTKTKPILWSQKDNMKQYI